MDYQKLAYDLALQYANTAFNDCAGELPSSQEKLDALFEIFCHAYNYYAEKFSLSDKL